MHMKMKRLLREDLVSVDLSGKHKDEVISELLDLLMKSGKVSDRETALQDLLKREKQMSTGMQYGVAIPHAKTVAVKELTACIGIHREGVPFDSLDGELSRILIMMLSPVDRTGPHIQFLADVSMVLKSAEARKQLAEAESPAAVLRVFGL
jgi:fructose-specific phosphotransferase system IIA component